MVVVVVVEVRVADGVVIDVVGQCLHTRHNKTHTYFGSSVNC